MKKPAERLYYIRNRGFCGDCLLWWRADRCGYTVDLKNALKVTEAETAQFERDEDTPYLVSDIDSIAQLHVNWEHMRDVKPCPKGKRP